jgi:hypothetical protein
MRQLLYTLIILPLLFSCEKQPLSAQDVVDKTIEASGGSKYLKAEVDFDFRDKHYHSIRDGGTFQYEREFKDSLGIIKDVLKNDGFKRYINNELVNIPDSMAVKYAASVNSVHYFAMLPYGLNDASVNKTSLGDVTIKGSLYHKIKVTFNKDGGGEDYEDTYIYWVNADTFKVDYLAYSYEESDGVGLRFREAYNERFVNGLRFVDYNNFKPKDKSINLMDMDKAFETGNLSLLSKIELKHIEVHDLPN